MTLGSIFLILFTGCAVSSMVGVLVGYIVCGFALNIGGTSTLVALSKFSYLSLLFSFSSFFLSFFYSFSFWLAAPWAGSN